MKKILVLGDIHGDFDRLNTLIAQEKPDIILQCGDLGFWPKLDDYKLSQINTQNTRIYFCDGNNDDLGELFSSCSNKKEAIEVSPGIFYMPRGSILEIDDKFRVLFLGGANSIDKHRRFEGWDWFPQEALSPTDLRDLPNLPVDIVISHTCPNEFEIEKCKRQYIDNDPSRSLLSEILHKYQPAFWYFGHWHISTHGVFANTKWFSLSWAKEYQSWYKVLPVK